MQKGSFEGIGIMVESGNQETPNEKIENDIDQEDDGSNGIQSPKAIRNC